MAKRISLFLLLLSNILMIAIAAKHVDPKKKYFTFDEEDDVSGEPQEENSDDHDRNSACVEKLEACARNSKNICKHLLAFLKVIDTHADGDALIQKLSFDVTLTLGELTEVRNILRSGKCPEDAISALRNFYPRVTWSIWFQDELKNLVVDNKEFLSWVTVTLLIFLLLMYWVTISHWWAAMIKLFALAFIGSVAMTWYRNYQKILSKKRVILQDGIPLACRPNDQSGFYSFWLYMKSVFSVMPDDCSIYYEADTVNPALESTIIDAVSETISRFILTPIPLIFEYLGEALRKLFQALPPHFWIPVSIAVFLFIIIYFCVSRDYRFRSFLFSIEPSDKVRPYAVQGSLPPGQLPSVTNNPLPAVTEPRNSDAQTICASSAGQVDNSVENSYCAVLPASNQSANVKESSQCCGCVASNTGTDLRAQGDTVASSSATKNDNQGFVDGKGDVGMDASRSFVEDID